MSMPIEERPILYGLMAEFDDPDRLLAAARKIQGAGYTRMDAYSPFPIEGLSEAVGFHKTWLPLIVLVGGILGGIGGFFLQYYAMAVSYPLNVGGRPYNSWVAFIPVTFELTILAAALSCVFGMIALNELPMPYHPVFNVERFGLASQSHFFVCVQSEDPKFDRAGTRKFLESLGAQGVYEVPE